MSSLFGSKAAQPVATPPSIDQAQENVSSLRRGRALRGRASTMLTQGAQTATTAKRKVTGS